MNLSGLTWNSDFPYLGASPDAIVNCSCCGVGCLEIKCHCIYKGNLIKDMIFGSCGYLEIWQWRGSRNKKTCFLLSNTNTATCHIIWLLGLRCYVDKWLYVHKNWQRIIWKNLNKMQAFLGESHITKISGNFF